MDKWDLKRNVAFYLVVALILIVFFGWLNAHYDSTDPIERDKIEELDHASTEAAEPRDYTEDR